MNTTLLRSLLLALCTLYFVPVCAQRIISELESNAGYDGVNEADSMMRSDAKDGKKKTIVPTDVHAWTIDPIYGNREEIDVDTLQHLFQNDDQSEGREGDYNTLANLGSPRINRIFMLRQAEPSFIFTAPFGQFITPTELFRYYNTKSPYMNLTYTWCGDKRTGHDRFRATYANNVNKRMNFGGIFDYFYGQGFYDRQSTSFMNATGFASYTGERYDLHFHYTHNYMKWGENGGIENDLYITNPEDQPQSYSSNEIPVRLASTWNKLESDELFLNHRYHIGFMRTDSDSISIRETFVPVTTLFHTFSLQKHLKSYVTGDNAAGTFHTNDFMPFNSTAFDHHRYLHVLNTVGISLREGFNRYAVAGLSAYVGFLHRRYEQPDIQNIDGTDIETKTQHKEYNFLIGGQIIRTQGRLLHYQGNVQFFISGPKAGELSIDGKAELNLPLLGDTAQVAVCGFMRNTKPDYFYEHFHSKHAWWDQALANTINTRIEGSVTLPHTRTVLSVGVENLKNHIYLANNGTDVTAANGTTYQTNNIVVRQTTDHVQVLSARLRQDLKLGPVHLDNVVTWQKCTHEDILPLPVLSTYSNLYLYFVVAKVLKCEIGGDMIFFTRYYAPDYSPAVGLFTTQHPDRRIRIGGYPLMSVYANVLLKKCRFYVRYYHVNQSDGRSFWAPHYPMNPAGVHFGISWNFYN